MEFEQAFEECKSIALEYGYASGNSTYFWDDLGCDFQIRYAELYTASNGWTEDLTAYLGGKRVYDYGGKWMDEQQDWLDLVDEINTSEFYKHEEEIPKLNNSKIEFFRKKADFNRRMLKEISDKALCVVKSLGERGESTVYIGSFWYDFSSECEGSVLAIRYTKDIWNDTVTVFYNKELVFSYRWDEKEDAFMNLKGYYVKGKWEKLLFELYTSTDEYKNRWG